jgi:hypothetical protein
MRKTVVLVLTLLQGTIYAQLSDRDGEKKLLVLYEPGLETGKDERLNHLNITTYNSIIKMYNIDSLKNKSKNNIYLIASFILIGGSATINYERMILQMGGKLSACFYVRLGYGYWADWTDGGIGGILSTNMLFFRKASHIETGFGAVALYDRKRYKDILRQPPNTYNQPTSKRDCMIYNPVLNLGYRYQDPGKLCIFRIGLSYPEGGYLGLGINF